MALVELLRKIEECNRLNEEDYIVDDYFNYMNIKQRELERLTNKPSYELIKSISENYAYIMTIQRYKL